MTTNVRVSSPYGDHFIVRGEAAPTDAAEDHLGAVMRAVRSFDYWVRTGEVTNTFTNELDSIECDRYMNE